MDSLQSGGVPAGVCQTAEDRCDRDPQLAAPELAHRGDRHQDRHLAGRRGPGEDERDARLHRRHRSTGRRPCYGEDNDYVYGKLLGLPPDEISTLAAEGVI